MDYDRLGWRHASGGATRRTFAGDTFTLDQENGLVGFALVLGAIAFDEHAEASVVEVGAGGKRYYNVLYHFPQLTGRMSQGVAFA